MVRGSKSVVYIWLAVAGAQNCQLVFRVRCRALQVDSYNVLYMNRMNVAAKMAGREVPYEFLEGLRPSS